MKSISQLKSQWFGLLVGLLLSLGGIAPQAVFAAGTPKYEGTFQLQPKVMHSGTISGKMDLLYSAADLTQVKLALDHPVFGMSNLVSSDQWSTPLSVATSSAQTTFAFRLAGPPHTWYFVMALTSSDGGQTLQGTIYRANVTLSEIQNTAKAPITTLPANWSVIGSAVLKAL